VRQAAALRLDASVGFLTLAWRMGAEEQQGRAALADGLAVADRTGDLRARVFSTPQG
jgi:hypothetical protein